MDHGGKCKQVADAYLACIREHQDEHYKCKQMSREYLECRMRVNLMAPEDLNTCVRCRSMSRSPFYPADPSAGATNLRTPRSRFARTPSRLGFSADAVVIPALAVEPQRGDFIAGLAGAKKAKGGFMGFQLPFSSRTDHS